MFVKVCFILKGRSFIAPMRTCFRPVRRPGVKDWNKPAVGCNSPASVIELRVLFLWCLHHWSLALQSIQSILLHVGNNTGSLPVFMTSSMAQTTGKHTEIAFAPIADEGMLKQALVHAPNLFPSCHSHIGAFNEAFGRELRHAKCT